MFDELPFDQIKERARCLLFASCVLAGAVHAAPVPTVSISGGGAVLIGTSTVSLAVTFDNGASPGPGSVGYGPFVDLYVPVNGADGNAGASLPLDGLRYRQGSARYLGVLVPEVVQTFPAGPLAGSGCAAFQSAVMHPYARDAGSNPVPVCGTPGDQLVTLRLPTISFTPQQPPATVVFEASVSASADQTVPLALRAEGGFWLGSVPGGDLSIYNPAGFTAATHLTPTVLELVLSPSGAGTQGTTGPGFPTTDTLTLTVAPGQTLSNLELYAFLDDNVIVTGITAPGAGSIVVGGVPAVFPLGPVAANGSANRLVVSYPSVAGAVSVDISSYIPLQDASGVRVLNPLNGAGSASELRVSALGDWQPLDPRDPAGVDNAVAGDPACPACPATLTRSLLALPVRKSVTNLSDASNSPGDVLQTSVTVQLSDVAALDQVTIIDAFSDGQRLIASPQLIYTQHGAPSAGPLSPKALELREYFTGGAPGSGALPDPDLSVAAGETVLKVDLSAALVELGFNELLGGCVPSGGTGSSSPDCLVFNGGPTTATLTYQTAIQDSYSDAFPSGDASVDLGDQLSTRTIVRAATILNPINLAPTGALSAVEDQSAATIPLASGALATTLYAITDANTGVTTLNPAATAVVAPGNVLTFRLRVALPSADFEDLRLTDYQPLPALAAGEVTTFVDNISNGTSVLGTGIPAAGFAMWGPTGVLDSAVNFRNRLATLGLTLENGTTRPTVTTPGGTVPAACVGGAIATNENALNFCFGDLDDPGNEPVVIDILYSVTVSNADIPAHGSPKVNLTRLEAGATNRPESVVERLVEYSAPVTPSLADVSISVTDAVAAATPGTSVSYTLVAANAGPDPVVGATVADTFPATLSCNWTCNGANGGSCTSSGTGSINDTIDLPAGATASYTAVCAIASLATGALSNTATISLNGGTVDPNPLNNSATDLTTLVPVADLQITVSDAVSVSVPGGSTSYVIAASNLGPSDTAAIVADAFPPTLACSWTCAGVNGGVCTAAGAGDIHDPVVLPSGASVSYTAACSISAAATGTLVNTATVTGVASDPSPGNNSATDSNTLLTLPDLSIDDIRLAEGNSGTTNFVFHVSLSAPALAGGVRFDLATSDGSALAPADYLASTQIDQLIPEGQSSVSVTVGVVGDAVVEPNEEFVVNLSNIRGAHLIDGQATGTILDEDTATRILSSAPNPSAVGQSYTVAVEVSGGVASPAGTVTISDGSNSCGPVALMAGSAPGSSASCALTSTMAGARTLTASYAPNSAAFAASSASASHQVNPAGTAIRVSGPSRSRINMPTAFGFELTVVAPGGGIPVGAVTLSSGSSSCQVTVPAASSCDLSFNLLGPRTVSASFTSSDGNHQASASSGSGDLQTLIYAQSDLAVSKTDTVDHYAEGELLVYTVQLRNSGPDQAANLRLRDQAPAGLVDVRWSCDASGGAACPASIGSGDLDAQVPSFPVGALLNYSFFGNVAGYPQQILNTAALQLPADSTIEDLVPANNSASDLNVRNLLLADGFEAVTVHAADGQYVLPSSALRTVLDATARAVYTLVDAHGPAARVYARIFNDQLQYALAQRDSNGRLRLGPWRSYPGEPQLRWTATAQAQGWVLQALSLE